MCIKYVTCESMYVRMCMYHIRTRFQHYHIYNFYHKMWINIIILNHIKLYYHIYNLYHKMWINIIILNYIITSYFYHKMWINITLNCRPIRSPMHMILRLSNIIYMHFLVRSCTFISLCVSV